MNNLRTTITACLILISSTLLHADDILSQPIAKYLNESTALVAWIDVNETDLDGLQAFARSYEVETGPMKNAKDFQQALKTLAVKRVFIIGSIQELTNSTPVIVLPSTAEKVDIVELVASATLQNQPSAVRKDGTHVLIGPEASLGKYISQSHAGAPVLRYC